jgi:hypothetical protein
MLVRVALSGKIIAVRSECKFESSILQREIFFIMQLLVCYTQEQLPVYELIYGNS